MGRSANERQNRGIRHLPLLLVAVAAQLGIAATVSSQSVPGGSNDDQVRRIPIVLARELRMPEKTPAPGQSVAEGIAA